MRKLDTTARYGTISGSHEKFPNAKYQQAGALFTVHGECLSLDGETPYDPKADKAPEKASGDEVRKADTEKLVSLIEDVKKLEAELEEAEKALKTAKDGDAGDTQYTANVSNAQRNVTRIRNKLTKANNSAATLQDALEGDA